MDKEEIIDFIKSYAGGQLSLTKKNNPNESGKHFCGTIEKIAIENNDLLVKLAWNAKIEPLKTNPQKDRWVKYDELDYTFDLSDYELRRAVDIDKESLSFYPDGYFLLNESLNLTSRKSDITTYLWLRSPKLKRRLNPLKVKDL